MIVVGKVVNVLLTFVICMIFSMFFSSHFGPGLSSLAMVEVINFAVYISVPFKYLMRNFVD